MPLIFFILFLLSLVAPIQAFADTPIESRNSNSTKLDFFIAFETKGTISKQKEWLIQESISNRIKEDLRELISLREFKVLDYRKLKIALSKTTENKSATLLITTKADIFLIQLNLKDSEFNHTYPEQETTCSTKEEIFGKSVELLRDCLGIRAQITKKIKEELYELTIDKKTNNSVLLPKKGDYFQIFKKTPSEKNENIYKWTALQITEVIQTKEQKTFLHCKLYSAIQLPDLVGLVVTKIPNQLIDIRFKVTPISSSSEMKDIGNYFPLEVVIRQSAKNTSIKRSLISKTNNVGLFLAPENSTPIFYGIAFVEILKNSITIAEIPYFKTQAEITNIPLKLEPEKPYETQIFIWLNLVDDQIRFMATLFKELEKPYFKEEELEKRIEKTTSFFKFTSEKTKIIANSFNDLKLKWPDITEDLDFKLGEKKMSALFATIDQLNNYQNQLSKIQSDKNSPQRKLLEYKFNEAKRMAGEGDFPSAISLLESIFQQMPEVETELKQYKNLWQNKSESTIGARRFLYESLPNLTPNSLLKNSDKLTESIDACIKDSDTAGLLKYQKQSKDLYLQLDSTQNDPEKSGLSAQDSLKLISLLEELNKRVKIFFETLKTKL